MSLLLVISKVLWLYCLYVLIETYKNRNYHILSVVSINISRGLEYLRLTLSSIDMFSHWICAYLISIPGWFYYYFFVFLKESAHAPMTLCWTLQYFVAVRWKICQKFDIKHATICLNVKNLKGNDLITFIP